MNATAAFLVRDFRVAWSYRFSYVFQGAALLFSLLSLSFLGEMFEPGASEHLTTYGGDYFSFALVGGAISLLAYPMIRSFADGVRGAQVTGTLEATFLGTSTPVSVVVAGAAYPLVDAVVKLALMFLAAEVIFGANLNVSDLATVLLALSLTIAALAGIGLLAAAFVLAFKQREPFSGAFVAASLVLSGVVYPTSVLPAWLELLAPFSPLTHAIELARRTLLEGAEPAASGPHLAALAAFALLLPLGAAATHLAVSYAKRAGSLSQY